MAGLPGSMFRRGAKMSGKASGWKSPVSGSLSVSAIRL